jgi:5-methylthioadenosine/S-adenosylhomocysteine deaminase
LGVNLSSYTLLGRLIFLLPLRKLRTLTYYIKIPQRAYCAKAAQVLFTKIIKNIGKLSYMQAQLKVTNAIIVSMSPKHGIIRRGGIAISNGKISAIGSSEEITSQIDAVSSIDAAGGILMPGLINCHTHAPMSLFRGMADDLVLDDWLNKHIFPAEALHINQQSAELGAKLSIMEMLLSGTTCFADMYYYEKGIAQICSNAGIRAMLAEGIIDFPTPGHPSSQHALAYTEEMLQQYRGNKFVSIAVGPHAPYTCPEFLLKECRQLAGRYGAMLHIHLSETAKEFHQCIEQTGYTPVQYLANSGILDGPTLAAHCVYASGEDVEVMHKHGTAVAHNPQCNMKLVSGVAPVPHFLKAGIKVGLGTDGVASNNSADMFAEMKACALIHKLHTSSPAAMPAAEVLRMATIGAAEALGMEDLIGSIDIGKQADILIAGTCKPHLAPIYDPVSHIVYSMCGSDVNTVIIAGSVKVENRVLTCFDAPAIIAQAQEFADNVRQGLS